MNYRYFAVSDADFRLEHVRDGVATYRAPEGLHPRAAMLWACNKVGNGVHLVRVTHHAGDGFIIAEAR